jgi:hypothetical protein
MWLNDDFTNNLTDDTQVESYSDSNFLNHPGFIGGTWWKDFWFPKKAEAERAEKNLGDIKASCGSNFADMDCAGLNDAYWCLDDAKQDALAGSTSSRGARRVRDRALGNIGPLLNSVENYQNSRDCEGGTSGLDQAYQDIDLYQREIAETNLANEQRLAELQSQTQLMFMQQKMAADKEKKTLMYVGAGIIGVMLVAMMIKSKNKTQITTK